MSVLVNDMMASMDAPWLKQMAQKQIQNFEAIGGIPVISRHFVDGKPQNETTLAKHQQRVARGLDVRASRPDIPRKT